MFSLLCLAFNLLQFDEKANFLFTCKFPIPNVQNQQKLILLAQHIQNTREFKMVLDEWLTLAVVEDRLYNF